MKGRLFVVLALLVSAVSLSGPPPKKKPAAPDAGAGRAPCLQVVWLPLPDGGLAKGLIMGHDGGLDCIPGAPPNKQRPSG
jgi:hypothetical protein